MKTKNGRLYLTKKEVDEFRALIEHMERNISYGSSGTFGDGSGEITLPRDLVAVKRAIGNLEWILEEAIN